METSEWPLSQKPGVFSGAVVFAGTRVPVSNLFDYLESGYTVEEFLKGFPGVSHDQVMTLLKMLKEDLCGKDLCLDSETVDENPFR